MFSYVIPVCYVCRHELLEEAMKAARLQMVVVTTDTPDFLITSPTWS